MKLRYFLLLAATILLSNVTVGQPNNGLESSMANLFMLTDAKTRSISPENFTGEKGKGGMATLEKRVQQRMQQGISVWDGR